MSTCPTCRKTVPDQPPLPDLFPFCSKRCKLVDLGRWFNGDYSIERDLQPDDLQPDDADSAEPSTVQQRDSQRTLAKRRSDVSSD